MIERLQAILDSGRDDALLRFSLGQALLRDRQPELAAEHLRAALRHDPQYSAAWRVLGQALSESGDANGALAAYRDGIQAAERNGDKQAAKQMRVFARRLQRGAPPAEG